MINFFRELREKMLTENRITRYLIYALGEIILVVIGILIALQINTWNDNRKNDLIETKYLENIQRDLNDQLESIEIQSQFERSYINAATDVLSRSVDISSMDMDTSFYFSLTRLQGRKTFVITDPTFTDLVSSGNINLLKDDDFKDELIQYYQELERIERVIQNNNSWITDYQFGPTLAKVGYYYNDYDNDAALGTRIVQQEATKFTGMFNKELVAISRNLMKTEENLLHMINAVNLRHRIALSHLGMMNDMKVSTQEVLNKIKL